MANCVLCGTTATEKTANKRGGAVAALHNDCYELEDLQYWVSKWGEPGFLANVNQKVAKLTAKHAGSATQWP